MKFTITFKTPDVVTDTVYDQIKMKMYQEEEDISELTEEHYAEIEEQTDREKQKVAKWIKYGEYVTIEFDTDKGTATVQEAK